MRIAIYARVSTRDQHVEPQVEALRSYVQRRGAEVIEFVDHASGANTERPALDRLMEAVRRREVDAVLQISRGGLLAR